MFERSKWRRPATGRIFGALVLAGATFVLAPAPASAFSCGTPSNYHVGYDTTSSTTSLAFTGASSLVDVHSAKLCSGGTNQFSNVYVMLASNQDYSNLGWAQAGYEYQPGAGIRDFAQTVSGGATYTYYGNSTLSAGTARTYASVIDRACGFCIVNSVGGRAMQIQYGGTQGWASPFSIQYSGEARYTADDIAGTEASKTTLAHMQYQGSDYALHTDPCGIFAAMSDSTRWKRESVGCSEKNVWTDPTN